MRERKVKVDEAKEKPRFHITELRSDGVHWFYARLDGKTEKGFEHRNYMI